MTKSELKAQAEGYEDVRDWATDNDMILCCICGGYRHIKSRDSSAMTCASRTRFVQSATPNHDQPTPTDDLHENNLPPISKGARACFPQHSLD